MLEFLQSTAAIRLFGLASSLAALLGVSISALAYRGKQGERYSPLNHFISELGERGVSRRAWAFNLGLALAGLLMLPGMVGLGLRIPGVWSKLAMLAGVVASISLAGVGLYPMNNLTSHTRAAVMYFRMGLAMILLFSIAIAVQRAPAGLQASAARPAPAIPRWTALAGLPGVLAYGFFLVYAGLTFRSPETPLSASFTNRPRLWPLAISEWLIFATTIPWFVAVALGL